MNSRVKLVQADVSLEIDAYTVFGVFLTECFDNRINIQKNSELLRELLIIRSTYGKVFGKVNAKGEFEEAKIPVKGTYVDNGLTSNIYVTTDEVIKGLFNVFKGKDLRYIDADKRGIYEDNWARGTATSRFDRITLLYEGQAAADVYHALLHVRDHWNEFVTLNSKKGKGL